MRIGRPLSAFALLSVICLFTLQRSGTAAADYEVATASTMDKIFRKASLNPQFGSQTVFSIGQNNGSYSEFDGGQSSNPFIAGQPDADMPSYVNVETDQRIDFTLDASTASKNCVLQFDLIRGYYSDSSFGGDNWLPLSFDVYANGNLVAHCVYVLGPHMLEVSSSYLHAGANELLFDFQSVDDGRDVAFDYIRLCLPSVTTPSSQAVINMGRNEYEAIQAVVLANKDLSNVTLETSDLVQQTGATLGRANISLRLVGYVPDATISPYLWPDPLPDYTPFSVSAGESQPIWITVYCPSDTPPGAYQGTLTITPSNAAPFVMPFTVNVLDFTLPVDTHLQFTFNIWNNCLANFHGAEQRTPQFDAIRQAYVDDFVRHRIAPMDPVYSQTKMKPVLKPDGSSAIDHMDYTQFDPEVAALEAQGLSCFGYSDYASRTSDANWFTGGPTLFDPVSQQFVWRTLPTAFSEEYRQREIGIYRDQAAHFREKGWLNDAYFYVVGEPNKYASDWSGGLMDDYQFAAWRGAMLHEADPGIRRMAAMYSTWDDNPFPAEFGDQIDIWCVSTDILARHLAGADAERAKGKEIWTYTPGYFNFDNLSSVSHRVGPWLCWKYNLKGWLHTDTTVWENPWAGINSLNDFLLYPGPNGPVDSVGWENLRDGMEDYEYFRLLKSKVDWAKTLPNLSQPQQALIAESEALLTISPTLVETPVKWSDDGGGFLHARDQIGSHIAALSDLTSVPAPVSAFAAVQGMAQVSLSWTNPADFDFTGTVIRCKTSGYPTGPTDGTLLCDRPTAPGVPDAYIHSGLGNATYYYAAFAHGMAYNYAPAKLVSALPDCAAVWLDEDFNGYSDGSAAGQGSWTATESSSSQVQSSCAKSGKAIALDPIDAGSPVGNSISFAPKNGGYQFITFDLSQNAVGTIGQEIGIVSFQASDSTEIARLHVQRNRMLMEYGPGSNAVISTSVANTTWYSVRVGFDADSKKMDVWLDGVSKSSGIAWKGGADIAKIVVSSVRNTGLNPQRMYIDNIVGQTKPGQAIQVRDDGAWTPSLSKLHFSFDQVGCAGEYRYAVGSSAGGTQMRGWTSCGRTTDVLATGLSLATGRSYYVSVQVGTGRGTWGQSVTSDGIKVATPIGIQAAKALPDGSPTDVYAITSSVVTAAFPGCFYIHEPGPRHGMKVVSSAQVSPGDQVDLCGVMKGSGAERYLDCTGNGVITTPGAGLPTPVSINERYLGGPALNAHTPGVFGAGRGLNNIGMFVALTGKIGATGAGFFYLDDGSGVTDTRIDPATGKPYAGVKILDTADSPNLGEFWTVRGISTLESDGTNLIKALAATSGTKVR